MNVSEAKLNPEKLFKDPYIVYNQPDITKQDKIDILTAWKNQLNLKINATGEGMVPSKNEGRDDDKLVIVNNLLHLLTDKK